MMEVERAPRFGDILKIDLHPHRMHPLHHLFLAVSEHQMPYIPREAFTNNRQITLQQSSSLIFLWMSKGTIHGGHH